MNSERVQQDGRSFGGRDGRPPTAQERDRQASAHVPARIKLLYESRDKQLCLFEDANGHLTAVRSARLA